MKLFRVFVEPSYSYVVADSQDDVVKHTKGQIEFIELVAGVGSNIKLTIIEKYDNVSKF